jgi:signal transduction histidine kinase
VSRIPVRIRVAAAFAVTMAIVLGWAAYLLYVDVGKELTEAVDRELQVRAHDLTLVVGRKGGPAEVASAPGFVEPGERYGQLLDERGTVVAATPGLADRPLLTGDELEAAQTDRLFLNRAAVPGLDEPSRFLAQAVDTPTGTHVLIVGATREDRRETLDALRTQLLIGGPIALAIATAAGYFLAGLSLRQVDLMRRRASTISAERPGERLPVPRTHDEVERLGETLNEMLTRLEAALQRERDFVTDAGHELRTPLALLRAELELALRHPGTAEQLEGAVRRSSAEVDRLAQLAEDLLLIARSDGGQVPLRRERLDVRELMTSVAHRFEWRADDTGVAIVVSAPDRLDVNGDRLRLEQALGNLVDNALRYGAGPVELSAAAAGGGVELHVRDHGNGFDDEFIGQAFERFTRADHARSRGGAGLGLSIVRTVALAHGGAVRAQNADEGGADVAIVLPGTSPDGPVDK